MNSLSGIGHRAIGPADLLTKINDRFQAIDADQSGTLEKSELMEARSARGLDTSRIDKVFAWLDMDGDAVVSRQEHEDRLLAVAERRGLTRSYDGQDGKRSDAVPADMPPYYPDQVMDALRTLAANVDSATMSDDQQLQLEDLGNQIEANGLTAETLTVLVDFFTSLVPPIDAEV